MKKTQELRIEWESLHKMHVLVVAHVHFISREVTEKKSEEFGLVGFLTSSSTTGYIADGPQDRASDNFRCCHT